MGLLGRTKERILLHLDEVGEDYGYSISDELDVQLPAVYNHLKDLEGEGVLESTEEGDKRVYCLTGDGKKLVQVIAGDG